MVKRMDGGAGETVVPRIQPGTTVTWTSQGGSHQKEKTGTVLGFVPAWVNARYLASAEFAALPQHTPRRRFDGLTSAVDRYIVEVPRTGAKGQALPAYFYAPLADVLERQNKDKVTLEVG